MEATMELTGNFRKGSLSILLQGMIFCLCLAVSWAGNAQQPDNRQAGIASVEVEQVNINRADAETIARVLDGIGISRAEAIVTYREEFGDFTSVDDLRMVRGVGEVTLRNNASRIKFDE